MKKFYRVQNAVDGSGSEIYIDGTISTEEFWGDESTPRQLREELKGISGKVTVIINSGGGDVWAGVAMYNALRELDATVTVRVDGLAASIASVIAMAGDEIVMSPGSNMMIHKASTWAGGNADDLAKTIEMLESIEGSIGDIYAERTGKSREEIQELLNAETWFTAEEAVAAGFADRVGNRVLEPIASNALSGKLAFSMKATEESIAKAKAAQDSAEDAPAAEAPKEEEAPSDSPEPTTPAPEDEPAPVASSDDEGTDDEEQKDDEEKETVAADEGEADPAPVTNKAEKVTTTMSKDTQSQVVDPQNAAPVTAKADMSAYLKTNESMEAFARILEGNVAADLEDKGAADRVRAAWKSHLETTMGVTNPEVFLPQPLIQEIEDAFANGGEIWNRVSKTGLDAFQAAWDANSDPDEETGRAKGYNRATEEEKAEQEITINARIIRPQFVYKYITLNREDVKEQRSTGALVRFVLSELPRRIIREVERAIVIGDGRASNSPFKIQAGNPRGFFPVKADAATVNSPFARTYTPVAGQTTYETLRRARALVKADGGVILVAKEGLLLDMEFEQNANGGFLFAPGSDLNRYIKVDAVVEPDWMENDENDAYIFAYNFYRVVGDQSVEAFTNFILKTNKNEYLQEIWAGGGLTARRSAVAIAPASGASS